MLLATWKTERFHVPARRNAKLEKWRPFGQSSPDVFDWICMYAYADFTGVFFSSGHTWIALLDSHLQIAHASFFYLF
jgi:hypothetical protein